MKQKKIREVEYKITCPNCSCIFDVTPQLKVWKEEFIKRINDLVDKMVEESKR